jgi:membrane-associated phospholipid phosphatase
METVYLIQSVATPWLDTLMTWITDLGSQEAYVALIVITYLGIDAAAGRALGIALLSSFMLNQYAKGWFDTPRPFTLDESVIRTQRAIDGALGAGFPSGHAQSSTTFWGLAALLARRAWFTILAVVVIAAVAFSRLYLGVHVPLDVWAGLAIGLLVVALAGLWVRSGFEPPLALIVLLGVAVPLTFHLLWPTPESDLLTGALAALALGPLLVPHRTDGPILGRVGVTLVGLVLAFTFLAASSELLPEAVKRDPLGGYVRYVLLASMATVVAPWIGLAFGWVPSGPPAQRPMRLSRVSAGRSR